MVFFATLIMKEIVVIASQSAISHINYWDQVNSWKKIIEILEIHFVEINVAVC